MKNSNLFAAFLSVIMPLLLTHSSHTMASEADAVALSRNTQSFHMPYNLVVDFISLNPDPNDKQIIAYEDVGDAALWTGIYLASESFRYYVTKSPEALTFLKRALYGIKVLSEISGDGYLARSIFAVNGPFVDRYKQIEGGYGLHEVTYDGVDYYWQERVTRDQYAGVFFGLSIAYDYVDDAEVRATAKEAITRLATYLDKHHWTLKKEHGLSTSFLFRPEQMLSILQVAKHVNPQVFEKKYKSLRTKMGWGVKMPIWVETRKVYTHYYKHNLNYIYLYNLLRYEPDNKKYLGAYKLLRSKTQSHMNAFFNMIDFALRGPNAARDEETRQILELRLGRGFRQDASDLRGKYKACGDNRACNPIPLQDRAAEGFMWQCSPYSLYREGDSRIEYNGTDYTLPYWMGRAFGIINN